MADYFGPTMGDFLGSGKNWPTYPTLDVDGNFVFENDFTKPIGGRSSNTLSTDSELFNSLNFAARLSFLTHLTYAVVNPDSAAQNTYFRGEGLFMEEASPASDVPLFGKPILNYQLAYLNSAHGEDGSAREQGTAASTWLTIPVEKSTISTIKGRYSSSNPLVKYVHLQNKGGIQGKNADYITLGVDLIRGDYDLAITGTWRRETISDSPSTNDYLWQVSIGKRLFGPNGSVVIGYEFSRIGDQPDHTIGIALTFSPNFLERFQIPRGF